MRNSLNKAMSYSHLCAFNFILIVIVISVSSFVSTIEITAAPSVRVRNGRAEAIPFNLSAKINYTDRKFMVHNLQTYLFDTKVFKILKDDYSQDSSFIVGGRNYIFRLSGRDMSVTDVANVGPVMDNFNCRPFPAPCQAKSRVLTNQDNKVIMIDNSTKPYPTIVSCGTTKQGMCFVHKYHGLQDGAYFGSPEDSINYIASRKHTVGFTAKTSNGTSIFVIGHEYDRRNLSFAPPVLSSRVLQVSASHPPAFHYTYQGKDLNSSLDIHPKFKEDYPLRFIYGFSHNQHAYFIMNQPVSTTSSNFETKLGRVCLDDTSFVSYTEIAIRCESEITSYLLATAASLGQVGEKQYTILNSSSSSSLTLFVSFMRARYGDSVDMSEGSVLCGFNMDVIDQKFFDATDKCFSGDPGTRLLEIFEGTLKSCMKSNSPQTINKLLCGKSIYNHHIEGKDPLIGKPLLVWKDSTISSLVTDVQGRDTIVFMGNERGNFAKAVLSHDQDKLGEILYNEQMTILLPTPGHKEDEKMIIRKDPVLTKEDNNTFVYFASGYQVTKFPGNSCSIYSSCATCITSKDPLECGWCGSYCAAQSECPRLISRSVCSPVIFEFSPNKGPVAGGTKIEIKGDSFGLPYLGGNLSVNVAGTPCIHHNDWKMDKIVCETESATDSHAGFIEVTIRGEAKVDENIIIRGSTVSKDKFHFVDAQIFSIEPLFGPKFGGTYVSIRGVHLDTGGERCVLIGERYCKIYSVSLDLLICITHSDSDTLHKLPGPRSRYKISAKFDKQLVQTGYQFTFMDNPLIESIEPKGAVFSGRNPLIVTGKNFDSISKFSIMVSFNNNFTSRESCEIHNATHMTCFTAKYPFHLRERKKLIAKASIVAENQSLSDVEMFEITYHPDPMYYKFVDNTQKVFLENPVIEISGKDINVDYMIFITVGNNNLPCDVLEHERTKLWCKIKFQGEIPKENNVMSVDYKLRLKDKPLVLGDIVLTHQPRIELSGILLSTIIFLVFAFLVIVIALCYCRSKRKPVKKADSFQVVFSNDRERPEVVENGEHIFSRFLSNTNSFFSIL